MTDQTFLLGSWAGLRGSGWKKLNPKSRLCPPTKKSGFAILPNPDPGVKNLSGIMSII